MSLFRELKTGQAALPMILLISGIIIETALGGTMVALLLSDSGLGERLSNQAFAAAESGIQDAFLQIAGNKDYCLTNPCGCSPDTCYNYNFSVGNALANVKIIPGSGDFNIISVGNAFNRQRKLEAVLAIDPNTGKADLKSIKEAE